MLLAALEQEMVHAPPCSTFLKLPGLGPVRKRYDLHASNGSPRNNDKDMRASSSDFRKVVMPKCPSRSADGLDRIPEWECEKATSHPQIFLARFALVK